MATTIIDFEADGIGAVPRNWTPTKIARGNRAGLSKRISLRVDSRRSSADGNSARLTRLPLFAFTQLDKIDEAFHRELSSLVIGLAMIDEGLPLDGNLQHLVQSGA